MKKKSKQRLFEVMNRLDKTFKPLNEKWETVTNDAGEPMGTEYRKDQFDPDYGDDNRGFDDNQNDMKQVTNINDVSWDALYDILFNNTQAYNGDKSKLDYTVNGLYDDNIISQQILNVLKMANLNPNWGVDYDNEASYPYFDVNTPEHIPTKEEFIKTAREILQKYNYS